MDKKCIIENDKGVEAVITELDEKKNEALQKVNKDFGSIFSTLLPGAFAKLEPLEGMMIVMMKQAVLTTVSSSNQFIVLQETYPYLIRLLKPHLVKPTHILSQWLHLHP